MRKKMMAAVLTVAASSVYAQEMQDTLQLQEVVVTGTKFEVPVEKSGKTIYKISQQEIERNAGKSVADLLNQVPGMEMNGTYGPAGSNISYSMRGGRSKHTLILIDGVPLNDPAAITASYDLRFLALEQVESIEILNGGLSTLYGTGAAAGVINIRLKKASEGTLAGSVDINGGSYGTFAQNLNLNGSSQGFSYLLSAGNTKSEGFSAAQEGTPADEFDNDGFSRQNIMAKLGYQFNDKFEVIFGSAFNQYDAEYDDGAFFDADNELESDELRFTVKPTFKYGKGSVSLNTVYNINNTNYKSSYPSEYEGRNWQVDLVNEHQFTSGIKGLFGINLQRPRYAQEGISEFNNNEFTVVDPYASLLYESNFGLNVHMGTRLNHHSEYGNHLIYNINPSYLIDLNGNMQVKFRGSVSTAFITPSLYQLYSIYGNTNLKPEESTNYDAGLSFYLGKQVSVNATYYVRDEGQPISFVSIFDEDGNYVGGQYQNIQAEREVKGVEFQADWSIIKSLGINVHYSKIDQGNSSEFYRIPASKWGAGINWRPIRNGNLSLTYKHTGERTDLDFITYNEVQLESYDVMDVYADYTLLDRFKVYGAVNNIFDEQFVNTVGFNTRGRNYNIGISYKF